MNIIELRNINKIYGSGNNQVHVLKNVNLDIESGDFCRHYRAIRLGQIDSDEYSRLSPIPPAPATIKSPVKIWRG